MDVSLAVALVGQASITAAIAAWLLKAHLDAREIDNLRRHLRDRDARIAHLEDERLRRFTGDR